MQVKCVWWRSPVCIPKILYMEQCQIPHRKSPSSSAISPIAAPFLVYSTKMLPPHLAVSPQGHILYAHCRYLYSQRFINCMWPFDFFKHLQKLQLSQWNYSFLNETTAVTAVSIKLQLSQWNYSHLNETTVVSMKLQLSQLNYSCLHETKAVPKKL